MLCSNFNYMTVDNILSRHSKTGIIDIQVWSFFLLFFKVRLVKFAFVHICQFEWQMLDLSFISYF